MGNTYEQQNRVGLSVLEKLYNKVELKCVPVAPAIQEESSTSQDQSEQCGEINPSLKKNYK